MANPQPNQFTRISNELLEVIIRQPFTTGEFKVILKIIRETYGWSRKKSQIYYANLARAVGLSRRHVMRVCRKLFERKIIFLEGDRRDARIMGLNKNYDEWCPQPVDNSKGSGTHVTGGVTPMSLGGSDMQDSGGSDTHVTHSKKWFKEMIEKKAEKKSVRLVDKNEDQKTLVSNLIKGRESFVTSNDPRALVNKLIEYGFDLDKVWGAIVQARAKRNPPGYLVTVLADAEFAVADSAMEQAKQEMRKYGF